MFVNTLIVVIITFIAASQVQCNANCDSIAYRIEQRMRIFMFVGDNPLLPIDNASLKQYCDEIRPITKEMKDYRKCVDPFLKQVLSILLPNLVKSIKKACVNRKENTIANMQCAGKAQQQGYQKCFNNFSVRTKYMAYKVNDTKQLVGQMCCNFHTLRKCLSGRVKTECANPKVNLANFLIEYTNALGQEIATLSCAKYQDIGICEKLKITDVISKYKESDVKEFKNEFILIPLIKGTQNIVRT